MSIGEVSSAPISLARANSDKLRAPCPEEAVRSDWYSSSVRRKIKILLRGLVTAMKQHRTFRVDHVAIDFHRDRAVQSVNAHHHAPGILLAQHHASHTGERAVLDRNVLT